MYKRSKQAKLSQSINDMDLYMIHLGSSLNKNLQQFNSVASRSSSSLNENSQQFNSIFNFKQQYSLSTSNSQSSQLDSPFFSLQDQTLSNSTEKINLGYLNDYIIYELLDKLSLNDLVNLKFVNRRFYLLVNNYVKFNLKQILIYKNENDFRYFKYSCSQHKQTEYNSIRSTDNFELFLNSFLNNLTKLKVISLSFFNINETTLKAFSNLQCVGTTLEHLEISHCKFEKFYLTAASAYDHFFKKLGDKLKHFILFKNSKYVVPFHFLLKSINQHLINLDTLILDLKQFETIKFIDEKLTNCKSIKHLDLHGGLYPDNNCDKFISKLILNKQLEFLNLSCLNINQQWLLQILQNSLNIRVLKFSYDFKNDNRFGRTLITSNCIFNPIQFQQTLQDLQRDGKTINQFSLASKISHLLKLEELHLLEIDSADVNIDPLILYLYHRFKKNNLKRLVISNYEYHLMNMKAFCYVSKNLEVLSLNEVNDCCYSAHSFKPIKQFRTLNSSFANTIAYLPNLKKLILNQFNFDNEILKLILSKCGSSVKELSFLRCFQLNSKCIELFISYANANFDRQLKIILDYNLFCEINKDYDLLCKICPSNLNIITI